MSDATAKGRQRRADDAITGDVIRNWWPIAATVIGGLVVAGITYGSVRTDIVTLNADVATLKLARQTDGGEFVKLNKRIDRIDKKLGLILCVADRKKCASDVINARGDEE